MVFKKGVFCKGLLCDNWNRKGKAKCHECGCELCSVCAMKEEGKVWCPNCWILSFPKALNEDLDNLDKHDLPSKAPSKIEVVA